MRRRLRVAVAAAAVLVTAAAGVGSRPLPAGAAPPPGGAVGMVSTPATGNNADGLASVACPDATDCWAVGDTWVGQVAQTLIEHWDGTSWSITPSPDTATSADNSLRAVSCRATTECWAVGAGTVAGVTVPLAERWNGSSWSITVTPVPPSATASDLQVVSCAPDADVCVALGSYDTAGDQGQSTTMAEEWNGSSWSVAADPPSAPPSVPGAVACPSSTVCVATVLDGHGTTWSEWNGTSWADQGTPPTPGPGLEELILGSISCPTPTTCWAGGFAELPATVAEVVVTTQWSAPTSPGGPPTFSTQQIADPDPNQWQSLAGISCTSATSCWAAGSSQGSSAGPAIQPLVATLAGDTWSLVPTQGQSGNTFLASVACPSATSCWFAGTESAGPGTNALLETQQPMVTVPGYWTVASDGGIFAFDAPFHGSMGGRPLNQPIVALAPDSATGGYWEVASDGGIFAFDAPFYGSEGGQRLAAPIAAAAATPDGHGYWEVGGDGAVYAFGDAGFYGSMAGIGLNRPVVGMSPTADGLGYWLVASDGGIFAFGDAGFAGSMGGRALNAPVTGLAVDPATGGYWEIATDGGIFAFDAPFAGSMGGRALNAPVVAMAFDPATGGYWLVASDGGIFAFDAPFAGSMGGHPLNRPMVSMAT